MMEVLLKAAMQGYFGKKLLKRPWHSELKEGIREAIEAYEEAKALLAAAPQPPAVGEDVVRDAERYRWLRDECDTTTGFLLGQRIEADEWDNEIDAAMAASKGG